MPMLRQRVTSLSPLTQKQADYLYHRGVEVGEQEFVSGKDWWRVYFGVKESEINNPYFDSYTHARTFFQFRDTLEGWLNAARRDREYWKKLKQTGRLPPDPPLRDPYGMPDYFQWWQAENAFRRGFKSAWEDRDREDFSDAFGAAVRRGGGGLSADDARELGENRNVVIRQFFSDLGDAIEAAVAGNGPPPFGGSRKNALDALQQVIDAATPQFSPFYYPVRSVGGGGFTGVGYYGDE